MFYIIWTQNLHIDEIQAYVIIINAHVVLYEYNNEEEEKIYTFVQLAFK